MQTTRLGRTGLEVSVAGLGCGGKSRLGQSYGRSFDESVALVREALDAGVTLVDTASSYGTEEIVGAALRGRRDDVIISTKVPIQAGAFHDVTAVIDADRLTHEIDGCLRRLDVDHIDVLHIHAVLASQYDHVRDVLVPRLDELRASGKIRFIGLTERFAVDTTHEMALRAAVDARFDVLMIGLNLVNQTAMRSLLALTTEYDIGTLGMFAVRGALARTATANALVAELIARGEVDPTGVDPDDALGFLTAPGVAASLTEAAYRFCRHAPGLDVTITGTGSPAHLRENLAALDMDPLPGDVLQRLATMFGGVTSASAD